MDTKKQKERESKAKTLHLVLTFDWFDIMAKGLKVFEIRKPTAWIESRILWYDEEGFSHYREFEKVRFQRGYTSTFFEADFEYIVRSNVDETRYYSGKEIEVKNGDYLIRFGKVGEVQNSKTKK